MKALVPLFSLTLLMVLTTACGNRANQSKTPKETVAVDTFCSPDLTFHELKGHVQSCTTLTYEATLNNVEYIAKSTEATPQVLVFTKQGYLKNNEMYDLTYNEQGKLTRGVYVTDNNLKVFIKRDKNGYITSLTCEDKPGVDNLWAHHIDYKWNNKKQLIEKEFVGWEWSSSNQYKYDEKGLRQESKITDSGFEQEDENTSYYTYTKFDNKGNWTERNVQIVLVASTFDSESDAMQKDPPQESYAIQKREITYFPQ